MLLISNCIFKNFESYKWLFFWQNILNNQGYWGVAHSNLLTDCMWFLTCIDVRLLCQVCIWSWSTLVWIILVFSCSNCPLPHYYFPYLLHPSFRYSLTSKSIYPPDYVMHKLYASICIISNSSLCFFLIYLGYWHKIPEILKS